MKTVLLDAPGPPSALRLGEVKDPVPSTGDVLVRVHATALNPVDFKVAAIGNELWSYPHVLGVDAAGVVEQIGANVRDWRPGDRVFYHSTWRKPGTYAELQMVPSHTIARIPASVSYIDAAAIPCAGLTAYNALYRRLNCGSGDIVLVHAGSGGVGGYAIQLAKRVGATVVATCSAANADYVRELGADEVIDYRTQNVFARAQEPQFWRQQEDLAKMASEMIALVERSEIRSTVSSVIPLEEMPKSLTALAEGHVRGKIVARLIRDY